MHRAVHSRGKGPDGPGNAQSNLHCRVVSRGYGKPAEKIPATDKLVGTEEHERTSGSHRARVCAGINRQRLLQREPSLPGCVQGGVNRYEFGEGCRNAACIGIAGIEYLAGIEIHNNRCRSVFNLRRGDSEKRLLPDVRRSFVGRGERGKQQKEEEGQYRSTYSGFHQFLLVTGDGENVYAQENFRKTAYCRLAIYFLMAYSILT
ncbi:MAG: hypothetical protein EA427_09220 [Spirochaetaceae bacterium]|nr:MAG: hypothetical protein EA427_09220 [Spirochaetaceae bacterium]